VTGISRDPNLSAVVLLLDQQFVRGLVPKDISALRLAN